MPLLRDINPSADTSIFATSERISEAVKVYDKAIADGAEAVAKLKEDSAIIDIAGLSELISPESVLYDILKRYGFQPQTIAQVYANLSAPTGKTFRSSTHDLLFDRGNILIERHWETPKPMQMPVEGLYRIGYKASLRIETIGADDGFKPSKSSMTATLDMRNVKFPLTLRPYSIGDKFVPFGMKGFKLVSDYLTDRKKTLFEKRKQMVVADANNNILWLIGERTDNRFCVCKTTTQVLKLSFEGFEN